MDELDNILIKLSMKNNKTPMQSDKIKLNENIKIKKVAFDIYTIEKDNSMSNHYDGLWKLQDVDGSPHLVRASDPQYSKNNDGDWSATSNYDNNNIILAYKSIPIGSFSSSEYGYDTESISIFKNSILDMAKNDDQFLSDVLSLQNQNKCSALSNTFPELKKYIKG